MSKDVRTVIQAHKSAYRKYQSKIMATNQWVHATQVWSFSTQVLMTFGSCFSVNILAATPKDTKSVRTLWSYKYKTNILFCTHILTNWMLIIHIRLCINLKNYNSGLIGHCLKWCMYMNCVNQFIYRLHNLLLWICFVNHVF